MHTETTNKQCGPALNQIAAGDFRGWRGWPADCAYADFHARFPADSEHYGIGRLGTDQRPARYRMHAVPGCRLPAQVWFVETELLLIELNYPLPPHPVSALTGLLGTPEAKLDYHLDIGLITAGAWLFPQRGISLFMDAPGEAIMKIGLFTACSLEDYRRSLHFDAAMEELPEY